MTIIDGNNLLWALHESLGEREITNEIELCRVLSKYFGQVDEIGQVVFDGAGPADTSDFEVISNPEVFFAGFRHDADSVIEEKITVNTSPRHLTIISSDRRLRKAASARKATAMKSEEFWERVRRELRRKPTGKKEPEAKREGLTDGETDRWLEVFGIEE